MDAVFPHLHASRPEALPFGRAIVIRAFLLRREAGNLLLYRSAAVPDDAEAVRALGGIAGQYLNHWHEASPACDRVAETFGAPLHAHEADAEDAARSCRVDATFAERHRIGDDLEAVPTPGHTPGATAYLWEADGHRFLFTGDTLMLGREGWRAAVLDSSDRASYLESLELLRGLDFDVLVPSVAAADAPVHDVVDRAEARRRIDAVIARVRAGASG